MVADSDLRWVLRNIFIYLFMCLFERYFDAYNKNISVTIVILNYSAGNPRINMI